MKKISLILLLGIVIFLSGCTQSETDKTEWKNWVDKYEGYFSIDYPSDWAYIVTVTNPDPHVFFNDEVEIFKVGLVVTLADTDLEDAFDAILANREVKSRSEGT